MKKIKCNHDNKTELISFRNEYHTDHYEYIERFFICDNCKKNIEIRESKLISEFD